MGQQEDIFIARRDGSGMRQLTNDAARDRLPHWSPDGKRVAFYSNRGGRYQAWAMNVDGSGLTRLGAEDSVWYYPAWSPDSKRLSVATLTGESAILDVSTPGPGSVVRLPPTEGGFNAQGWSPDGRFIVGDRTGQTDGIVIYSVDNRTYEQVTTDGG